MCVHVYIYSSAHSFYDMSLNTDHSHQCLDARVAWMLVIGIQAQLKRQDFKCCFSRQYAPFLENLRFLSSDYQYPYSSVICKIHEGFSDYEIASCNIGQFKRSTNITSTCNRPIWDYIDISHSSSKLSNSILVHLQLL